MHAASRHGTPGLTSLPKDDGVSCFGRSSGRSPIQFFDRTQPCLTSVKLMELTGPLGHSPHPFLIMHNNKILFTHESLSAIIHNGRTKNTQASYNTIWTGNTTRYDLK